MLLTRLPVECRRIQPRRRYTRQGTGKGRTASSSSTGSPARKLSKPPPLGFYGGFTAKAWLIKSLVTGDWFNIQPLSPPQKSVRWGDWKFQPSNQKLTPLVAFQSHHININSGLVERGVLWISRHHYGSYYLGNYKDFRSSARNWDEDQICISYYKSQYRKVSQQRKEIYRLGEFVQQGDIC